MSSTRTYPPVVVVDENDNEIGAAMLEEAWQKGLYHRAIFIFILDNRGRMLLQLRSSQVKLFPSCWDQAVGGHVDEGFSYEQTAANEAAEELGLHDLKLETLSTFRTNKILDDGRIINRFERAYVTRVPHDIALTPDPEEVSALQWFTQTELKDLIAQAPEEFTPDLRGDLQKFFPEFA